LASADASLRSDTVSALYEKLKKYNFIQVLLWCSIFSTLSDTLQVRGTPASGKTTLCGLLAQYISQQDPAAHIVLIYGWPLKMKTRGWRVYLQEEGWVPGKKTVFIFDEAQLTYGDFYLWGEFFKNLGGHNDLFAIAFASYGSPTSHQGGETSDSDLEIQSTPFVLSDSQRVTLRPIDHGDGSNAVGLLFNRTEFDDLVGKRYPPSEFPFDPSLFDGVFDLTGGHVGAILDFLNIIIAHDVRFFMMSEHIT